MSDELQGGEPMQKDNKAKNIHGDSSQQNPNHPSSGSSPAPQVEPRPPTASNTETHEENPFKQLQLHVVEWKETYEFFGFLAGIAVLVVLICQYSEMVKATKVTKGQLDEMQNDERAWISPYQFTRWSDNNFTNSCYFIIHFKNIGKTPALHLQGGCQIFFSHDFIPITNFVPSNTGGQLLYPDTESQIHTDPIAIEQFEAAWITGKPAYASGVFTFYDIFGKPHWTRFCQVLDLHTGITYADSYGNECDTNN